MNTRPDNYSLKNASLIFKVCATLGILASISLLVGSWYISLTVLKNHRPSNLCVLLGDDLWALSHFATKLFVLITLLQACAYGGIFVIARALFRRAAVRRRIKGFLLAGATFLTALNQCVWLSVPFIRGSQVAAGYVGLGSAIALIALALPPLFQLWFYQRWLHPKPTRVVIIGGGFAGLYTALGLDKALGYHRDLEIVLIDRKNFFLFPPLLPSASVGTIESPQVAYSYRRILETTNIRYQKATVTRVDPQTKGVYMHVHLEGEDMRLEGSTSDVEFSYDYLVLAPGSTVRTFNTPGAEQYAFFVKELSDAVKIRNRIIDCFERAAVLAGSLQKTRYNPQSIQLVRELLRFVIVGGGPTGVEIATEIHDLIHAVLLKRYPEIDKEWPEVSIIQSGPQVLPGWPDKVVRMTTEQLKRIGIQLLLEHHVKEIKQNAVILKEGPTLAARTILWCAGVQVSPLIKTCGLMVDKSGRVPIDEFLRAQGYENVFVLGDSALCIDPTSGKPLPPLGQVAFQQGDHTAANLTRLLRGEPIVPFRYFNYGALVSVGEHYAAVDLLGVKISGFIGWFVWRTLYLSKIVGFSNKFRVMTDWTLDLLIERSLAQLEDAPRAPSGSSEAPVELATARVAREPSEERILSTQKRRPYE